MSPIQRISFVSNYVIFTLAASMNEAGKVEGANNFSGGLLTSLVRVGRGIREETFIFFRPSVLKHEGHMVKEFVREILVTIFACCLVGTV